MQTGRKFVSNKDESIQLFKNPTLEALTRVHPSTPLVVFVPVVIYFFATSILKNHSFSLTVEMVVTGLLFWTFFEYSLHRFLFHWIPENKVGRYLHFLFHGIHHDYPRDSRRLVMPPTVAIILSTLLFWGYKSILPTEWLNGFFSGFMLGYLCYDMTHFAVHHFNFKNKYFIALRNHHLIHHYDAPQMNYGVSTPVWDYVFMTSRKRQQDVTTH